MKRSVAALLLLFAACGPKDSEITLTVSGIGMSDLETIKLELSKLKGVGTVQLGDLRDGQSTLRLRYQGNGSALASELARLGSGLRNVKGFDAGSVQIAWSGVAPPAPAGKAAG